jgi:hypothetical protein
MKFDIANSFKSNYNAWNDEVNNLWDEAEYGDVFMDCDGFEYPKVRTVESQKAEAYDESIATRSNGGKKSSGNLTPEQRVERAKKAVQTRIDKYGQNRVKSKRS